MGSNCCKGDASRPLRSSSSIYSRSRAGASLDERFTSSEDAGGVRLTVSAARAGDSAVYTLQATNSAGKDTARVRLEVSPDEAPTGDDPPTFLRRLQDLTVKVGTRTRFLVEIVSSTECKVTWYRNERRLMEAERVSLVRDGTFWCADIAAVSVDDTGRWTCTAENAGGRASCSAHLNVLVPKAYKRPEFVEELRALLTEQGTVSLECKVVGVPTPVLRWFKDSREIKAGDVFALTANAEDPTSLGTYTCEAVNCMGRAYSSSKVHVVGRSREGSARPISSGVTPESPPIFTKELEDKFVRICEHLTLSCHIVVPPWPRSVVWYNKEGKVEPGDRYHVVEDGVGGYLLEVQSAEWPDEGEWKCVATSSGGRVGITSCYVSMEVPKNYRKPRFMENLQAVLTEEGLVSFECKVVGFPTPVLSWFKDGQELKPGDVYQLTGTNSLGSYCCIARNCMGQASSSAELTVEDIQNQLNEEEKAHLFSKNQAPKFIQGLKSVEAKIDEPFRFTIKVAIPPEPSVQWFRDEQPVDESTRCHLGREDRGGFYLDIQSLEFLDQAEWKCVALNDFGHSVTSCFLKLIIPRHYKKPRFLENLQAILSDEGAVNLECKVIGVPQPVLKWYKDGEELKPGDIHRIISGQDGTCCLGTYTCEAQNCMGIAASSASLLGFDDSMKAKAKKKTEEQALQRNLSLSTIHEERTSQMYDTPVGDITLDDKGEISFSFDGKEVSVSLYETPDLTEEEALQIVEMYADQLSENVTEHNVVELPPLRFVKETSTSGNLLMEAIIIDVSPEYFASPEEDLRTEADVEDISIADEMGPPQLSLDQDVGGEDYLEKTMALLSDEKADIPKKMPRKKSDSQRSIDDFYSLSMDPSLSEDKKDDDTQNISESFASAKSLGKPKSKSSKPSAEDGQESSDVTKTILYKDEPQNQVECATIETPVMKPKRERRRSRSSRRSSSGSEKSLNKSKEELVKTQGTVDQAPSKPSLTDEEFKTKMINISTSLSKVINDVQIIERDIILKSELMSSAATASRSLEIISSLIKPLSEIHSIADAAKESALESRDVSSTLFSNLPKPLKVLQQSLTIIEKCIDVESDNKTLVKKTCVAFIETCGEEVKNLMNEIIAITEKNYLLTEQKTLSDICSLINDMHNVIKFSEDTIKTRNLLSEASEIKSEETTVETKHLRDTQKAIFELKSPLNSLLCIVGTADSDKVVDVNKVTSSEVILNDMSASIQDLQAALEHIESLSVKESTTSLYKYNTGIIETVMDSVLKLRSSFEQLPTETKNEEDEQLLKQALVSIKNNLSEISSHIETIEKNVGSFDILQSDNKLEVLQKMAQILILLENNLPRLESMPEVKTHMVVFHKNLTRILENVIESNDAQKYFTLMEICDAINRLNASLKNLESDNVLALASLSNTFRIIQDTFIKHIFESELNCSILTNISEVLLSIQEALNHAEEISLQLESERVQDIASPIYDSSKANVVVEHIEHTIAVINTIKSIETTKELKNSITPALENICPVLEELKRNIASAKPANVLEHEHISEMSDASFVKTLATPLLELNNNILVLNQVIVDNLESLKENTEVVSGIAEPLHELHTTLEILQQDVISQYGEDVAPYEVSVNVASAVHNLQSCMVMIQEQPGVEGVDDMSTLEDISGIKTTAETIPSDRLVLPTADEIAIEHSVAFLEQEIAPSATAQALQTLNQHITILQNPEIVDALDTLSEVSDYSSLKSVALGLGELHTGIEEILHPFVMENSSHIANLINTSKLAAIAEPMQELQQSLSVLDTNNIPIYEHILEIPSEKIHSVLHSISDFKQYLGKCIQALFPAMETADKTIEISNKVEALREVCENLKEIIVKTKAISKEAPVKQEVITLEETVNNLLDATDVSKGIQIQLVKNITEELFEKVVTIQEELIQFTPHTAEKLTEEAKLIQAIDDIENNIAVLEQYDFVDLSRVSDITSCATPQLAMELESEPLVQMDDILQNAVNVLQDSAKETPLADLMILEDFFKTCKCEFTIIRLIISKSLSHKKIIRLIQEFSFLQNIIKDFKLKRSDLQLSDDIDGCLRIFFLEADGNLKTIQESLLKLVESQSELLFASPMVILQNANEDLDQIRANNENLKDVASKLIDIIEVAKPVLRNITVDIQEELKYPTSQPVKEVSTEIIEKIEDLLKYTEDRLSSPSLVKLNKKIILNLTSCLQKHQDYKDATGTGKHLIILKCLSECVQILKEGVAEAETSKKTKVILEDNALKAVLSEMLEPLHALHSQLKTIQEQVTSGVEEKSVSVDITTTESMIEAVSEIHKEIVQQIESAKSTVDVEDISLMMEADKQIHAIQDSLKSLENISAVQELQEIAKPIDEVEKSLHSLISSEIIEATSTESLPKEKSTELLLSINQFIELTETVEEITAVVKIDELKESANIARELRDSITLSESEVTTEGSEISIPETRIQIAQKLQDAISAIYVQVFDNTQELASQLNPKLLERFTNISAHLQDNLARVTGVQTAIAAPTELKTKEVNADVSNKISVDTIAIESATVAEITKPVILEQLAEMSCDIDKTEMAIESIKGETETKETVASEEKMVLNDAELAGTVAEKETAAVIESCLPIVIEEAEQMKPQDITENQCAVVDRSKPEVAHIDQKHKEASRESTDGVKQCIENLLSADMTETLENLTTVVDTEKLKQTVNIAKELRDNLASIENTTQENSSADLEIEQAKQAQAKQEILVKQLQNALLVVQEQIFENYQQAETVCDTNKLQKVSEITVNLQTKLSAMVSTPQVIKEEWTEVEKSSILSTVVAELLTSEESKLIKVDDVVDQQIAELVIESEEIAMGISTEVILQEDKDLTKEKPTTDSTHVKAEESIIPEVEGKTVSEATVAISDETIAPSATSKVSGFDVAEKAAEAAQAAVSSETKSVALGGAIISENLTPQEVHAIETTGTELAKANLESGELVQHIDVLISEEMAEAIEELATVTDSAALKNTVEIAKELRECLIVGNQDISLENATPSVQDTPLQQGKLKYKLNEALINIQTTLLDSTQDASLLLSPEKLERISKAVTHVMEDLKLASISEIQTLETEFTESTKEESMKQLECLLQEVTDKIDLSSSDRVPEDTEALRDSLDEVQTVIIKLKRDFDGANDTLNETLEDLECSVRSVQLQINEDSPPDLLKEACATLQLLVNNMSETNEARVSEVVVKEINLKDVFEKCSNETSETVQLLEKASNVDTKVQSKLGDIVSNLNTLTVSMKSLKSSFVGNAETLIEKGIDIMQSLDQMEEKVFLIEKELDSAYALPSAVRDNIVTAVHSVYGSISNMRSTISTAQKQYIFENYGKPSENLIHSIKNVSSLANSSDDEVEKAKLKKFSKSLRNVLNHFEDIKFYINLDKTARLPSDAAFTKVILEELKCNVQVLPTIMELDNILKNKISNTLNCIETNLHGIEERSTLEVKEKIPIFKDIASKVLDVTSNLKVTIENRPAKASSDMKLFIKSEIENEQVEVIEVAQDHTTESLEAGTVTQIQISEEMAIAVESPKDQIEMGVVLSQAENKIETTQSLNEIALASASEQVQEELVKAQSLEVQVTGQITDTVDIATEAATAQEDLLMAQTQVVQATDQITDIVKVSLEAATAVLQESSISADDKQKVAIENIDEKHIPESAQQLMIQESDKEEVVDSKTQKMEIEGKAGPSTRPDTVTESSATTHSETEEAKSSDGLHSKEPEDQSVKEKTLEALHEKSQNEIQTDDQNLSAFEEKHSSSEEIKLSEEVQIQEKDQHLSTSPDQKDVHSVERSKVQDEQLAFDKAIEKPSVSEDESSGKNEVIEANKRPECKEFNLEEKMDEIKPGTSKGGEKLSKEDKVTLKEDQTQKNHMLVQVGIEEQMKIIERVEAEATEPQKDKKSELEKNAKLKMENQSEVFKSEEQEDKKIEEDADNLLSQEEKTVQKEDKVVGEQKEKEFKEVEDKRTKEQQKENDKLEVENREKLQNVPIEAELKEKEMEAKQKSDLTLNKQEAEGLRHEEKEKQQEELKEKELLEIQTEKSKLRDLKDLTEEVILKQQKASELLRDEKETRLEKVEQHKQKEPEEKEDEEEQLQQLKEKETNEKQIKKQEEGTEILRLEEEKKQKELLENEEQQKKKHEIKQKEEEEIKLMEQANETEKHKDEEIQLETELATKQKEDELKQTAQENETQILRVKEDRKELADNKEKDELQEEIVLEEKRTKEQREEMERIEEKKQEDDTQKQMLKELEIQKEELKIKEQEMSTNKLRNEEDKKQQETELTKQPKEEETKLEQQKEEETKLRTQKEEKLKIKEQEIEVERLRVEAENKQKEKEEAERKQTEHEIQEEEQRKELEQKEERIKEQEEKRIKEQEETRVKKQEEKRIKEQQDEAERLRMEEEKKQLESLRVEEERRLKEQEETDLKVLEDEKIRREKEEERKRKELTEKQNEEELIVQKEKDLREKRIKEQQKELEEQKRQEELFKKEEKDKKQKEQEERHIKEQEEAERLRVEEEMKQQELLKQEERERTQRELALKQEEEELKVKKEKDQEERRIKEEEAKRLRVEEEMKQQELLKKEEEERKQTELALKKEEEELKLKKEKELEERRIEEKEAEKLRVEEEMKQQELLKKENEERKQRELALKKEEEELKIKKEKELEERHINEIEAERLRVEEEMKRQELLKKEEEEQKQRELAIKQEEAELKVKKEKELEENRIKEEEAERLRVEEEINRQELLKKEEEERKQRELAIKKEEEELKLKKEKELEERRIKEEEAESLRLEEEQKQQELLKKEEEERRKEKLVKKKKDKESKLKKEKELEEKRIKEQEEAERLRLEKEKQRMEKEEDERKQKELLEKQNEENKLKKEKELEEKRTKDQEEAERLRLEAEKKQAEEELKLKEKEAERLKNEKESKQQEEEERRKKEIEQKRKEEMELKERQLEEERLRLEAEKKKAEEELKLKEKEAERLKIEKENNEQEKEERRKKEIEQKQKEELELKERQKEEERLRREVEKKQVEEEERRKKEIEQKQKEELKEQQEKEKKLRLDEEKKQIIKKEEQERKIELEEKNKENEMELKKESELEEKRIKEQQEEAERLKLEEENKRRESLKRKKDQRKQKQLAEKQAEEKLKRKEDEQKEEELKLKEKELEESRVKEQQENEKLRIDEDNKLQEALKKEEERKQKEQKENELKHKEKELEDKRIKEERDRESEKQRIQKEEEKAIKLQQKVQEEEAAELKKKEDEQRLLKVKAEMEEKRLEEERRKQNDLAMQKVKEEAEKLKQEKAEKKRLKKAKESKAEKKASKCVEDKQELEKSDIKSIEVGSRNGAEKNIETVPEDLSKPKLMTSDDGDDIKPDDLKKRAKKKEDLSEKTERDSSYSTEKLQSLKTDHSFSEKSPIKLIDEKFTRKDLHEEKGSTKLGNDIRTDERIKSYATSDSSQNYIKEYHYEPTARPKHDDREKPRFVDHNHRDYTMEFARPSAYREKTIEIENISFEKNTGRGHIYKANNLMMDAQLRASAPPRAIAPESSRRSEPVDRRSEAKHRSKALSEARSIISEKRSGASRDIKRKPVFSTFLTDRTAVEGSRVKLTCSVLSSSDPKVTWYKNGVLLDNKLKYRTKIIDGLITLEVLNAVPSDSAEYSCTVENENGSINTSANLKVYPSFEASPIPPTFTRSIRDTYHLLENELVLECRIRGQPLPSITWLKDDKPVSMNERFQAYYLADGVCRLAISAPTPEDSGKYTCKAENSVWSDQITHIVNFTGKESRLSPNLATIERLHAFSRQSLEARRPHFGNVLTDYKVTTGGTIGLQVEIKGSPTRVEWLREGHSVMETYSNARTYVEQGLYTLALSDVTEKESGLYTCRAWSNHGTVDMNAAITVVQPNEMEGKPAIIVGRPEKDVLISVGEDLNISFRVQGEPKPKVIFMKGIRDITNSQRVCKMTSDDYVKFTVKRSVISDAGTYCILARNAYGCDRAFVTVVVRQRASSENLISDWTYPMDDSTLSITERNYKSVPDRIPGEPSVVDGGSNWLSIAWPKPDPTDAAPVLAYKVESWLAGKEGGARWTELGITPLNSFDAFNLRQGEEYHFRVTPRNRYGWGESVQTSSPIGVGLAGDRPEFVDILPGLLKVLIGETANLSCSVRGKPTPEVVWMKNGHEVDEDARVTTSFNGFNCSLVIKGICPEDEARYSCEATNVHGRASTYARVAVVTDRLVWEADAKLKRERSADASGEYPPQFTMRLRDRRVQATYPVRLTCQVVGSPPPSVTWFKDGEEVEFDKRHTKSQDEHFHTLEIAPTTLEDGGLYEVMARNSCGAISCHCNLVVDKGIRAYVAPEFCCGLEPLYRLREGEELRISAVVEAYPTVGVTWYRDGVRLRPSRRAIMTLDRDGQIELALAFVTPRDAGVYTCTASNEVGRATTSGKVEVIGDASVVKKKTPPMLISPDVPYSKEPMFIRKPRSSEAREGDTVIIQCEVVGDPKPDVYWLRDFLKPDYYRDATHFKRVGDGPEYRFEIPHAKLDYTGAYSVVARNVHGEAKAIISLQILAKDPSSTEEHNIRYGRVDVIPRFERNLTDLLCYDGDAIEFECHVSGHPEPDIRWFHYNELIRENPDFEWSLEDGTARLKIKQVTAEDEGTYLCEASNSLGKATSSACLVVYPPGEPNTLSQRLRRPPALLSAASTPRSTPRSTPARSMSRTPGPDPRRLCSPSRQMPPKFYTYPFNKVVEEGETVVFQCAVKGLPAPWATWDKDGVIITPSARITIKEKDEILRILEIEEVTIEDVGVYRITLENDLGRVEASARLEVITQKGKFYAGVRSYSPSPRKSLTYRRRPSRQD